MTRLNDLPRPRVLMIAYTNYENDPRVVREAKAAVWGGFDVDVIVLEREGQLAMERVSGVMVHRVKQARYRGGGLLRYVAAYLEFFLRCFAKVSWMHLQNRYRVVHVNNMPDFLVFCALLPRMLGAKVILDIHDPMPDTFASKFPEGERSWFPRGGSISTLRPEIGYVNPPSCGTLLMHDHAARKQRRQGGLTGARQRAPVPKNGTNRQR